MATFRYWRFSLNTRNPNGRVGLYEIALRGTLGGATLTAPGGAISSDNGAPGYNIAGLVDGNTGGGYWESAAGLDKTQDYVNVVYDFGTPTGVAEGAVFTHANTYLNPALGSFISGSADRVNWTVFGPPPYLDQNLFPSQWIVFPTTVSDVGRVIHAADAGTLRLPTAWPTGPLAVVAPSPSLRYGYDTGALRIAGNVYIDGAPQTPVARRVRLFDRLSARLVREVFSDPSTGAYAFTNLPPAPDGYFVVSDDYEAVYNAIIDDRIQAVP